MKLAYLLLLGGLAPSFQPARAQAPASLTGNWQGSLGSLTLTAHLSELNGVPTGTLDVVEQNAKNLPLAVQVRADSLYLRLGVAPALCAAGRAPDSQSMEVLWRQHGRVLPLTLDRVAAGTATGPRRPQQPQAPFP